MTRWITQFCRDLRLALLHHNRHARSGPRLSNAAVRRGKRASR